MYSERKVSSSRLYSSSRQGPCIYPQISGQVQHTLSSKFLLMNKWSDPLLSFFPFLSPPSCPFLHICYSRLRAYNEECITSSPQQEYSLEERFLLKNGCCGLANAEEISRLKAFWGGFFLFCFVLKIKALTFSRLKKKKEFYENWICIPRPQHVDLGFKRTLKNGFKHSWIIFSAFPKHFHQEVNCSYNTFMTIST